MNTPAGAGGNWPTLNLRQDARAIAQQENHYCGCACAQIVLKLLSAPGELPTQDSIYDRGGNEAFNVKGLELVLNEIHQTDNRPWKSGHLSGDVTPAKLGTLVALGPWVAMLYQSGQRLGHLVVVVAYSNDLVEVLDPWRPGTAYQMTYDVFVLYWTSYLVYREDT